MSGSEAVEAAGLRPTKRQLDILSAYCKTGSIKQAAFYLGVGVQTVRSNLSELYAVLDVHGAIEASVALGWTVLPPDLPRCNAKVRCPYLKGHTGRHFPA
jgi:hypothetical protein